MKRVLIGYVAVTVLPQHNGEPVDLITPTVYVSKLRADERASRYVARKGGAAKPESAIGVPCYVEVPDNG